MAKLKVLNWSNNPVDYIRIPITSTVAMKQGDLINIESNVGLPFSVATDDATLAGIAFGENSTELAASEIVICTLCEVEADVTSATYALGAGLKYSAGSTTVDWSFVADGSANTIAWAYREEASAVTSLRILFDVRLLGKLFVSASA